MLTSFEVWLHAGALVLLPLAVHSLITGSKPPEKGWFAKYYRVERHLNFAGNVFLLVVCASAIGRLGMHFGYINRSVGDRLGFLVGLAFMVTLLAFLGLWIRAAIKVRRLENNST